ncbi:MAG: NADH dehydrogenase subunit, partial [Bacteroidales bacterium]
VYGRLRTPILNFFQEWCGNRLAKGLIRPGGTHFPFTEPLAKRLLEILSLYEPDLNEMSTKLFKLPSALSRFEKTGVLHTHDALSAGIVGVAARMSGVNRDIRASHPYGLYTTFTHEPIVKHHGDVYSRTKIRWQEIEQSAGYIRSWVNRVPERSVPLPLSESARPQLFAISLVEGWRGEICHCAITGAKGELVHYKVKDPSFHNWLALALAVRNNEISDFPVCNKSFNLSYAAHDL